MGVPQNEFQNELKYVYNTSLQLANDKATQEEKNAVLAPLIEYEYNRNNFGDIIPVDEDDEGPRTRNGRGELAKRLAHQARLKA